MWSAGLWDSPLSPLREAQEVKTAFIRRLRHYLPFTLCDICYGCIKAKVGKTAGFWAWIKAVVPNWIRSHSIIHCHLQLKFCFKNILDKRVKINSVLKPWSFFLIFWISGKYALSTFTYWNMAVKEKHLWLSGKSFFS